MKQIKVNDDVYTKLKALADSNYRTMGGQIDFMMSEKPPVQVGNVYTSPKQDNQVVAENEYVPDPEFGPSVESMLNSGMIKKGF